MGSREIQVAIDGIRGERRIQRRYPVALQMEYKVMEGGEVIGTGAGKTENISSGGVLFQPEGLMAEGPTVELSIRWPALPGDEPCMDLRVSGRVLRSDANGTAVQMCRHHFEKPGDAGAPIDPAFGDVLIQ